VGVRGAGAVRPGWSRVGGKAPAVSRTRFVYRWKVAGCPHGEAAFGGGREKKTQASQKPGTALGQVRFREDGRSVCVPLVWWLKALRLQKPV